MAVDPDTNRIYVANVYSNSVYVIDGASNTVVASVAVGNSPEYAAVNPSTNRIYAANSAGGTLSVIDYTVPPTPLTPSLPHQPTRQRLRHVQPHPHPLTRRGLAARSCSRPPLPSVNLPRRPRIPAGRPGLTPQSPQSGYSCCRRALGAPGGAGCASPSRATAEPATPADTWGPLRVETPSLSHTRHPASRKGGVQRASSAGGLRGVPQIP